MNETGLHDAAARGYFERVRRLLAQGHDVNGRNFSNETPLHVAARGHALMVLRLLVRQGAAVNAQDERGWTPLHRACYGPRVRAACEFLLSSGADMTAKTGAGDTMLHLIICIGVDPTEVRTLFDSMSADPRPLFSIRNNKGNTPLHHVRLVDLAKCLIECSFDPETSGVQSTWMCPSVFSIRNNKGETPLDKATRRWKHWPHYLIYPDGLNYKAVKEYLDSFESLPLVDVATMMLTKELNQFQRFLARRIYYTILRKLSLGTDIGRRVMTYLSPADVMK
jgi:hypothetical protein